MQSKATSTKTKFIYFFAQGKADGNTKMRDLLGGKGADLAEMTNLGNPVPPGFTISTKACIYYQNNQTWPPGLEEELKLAMIKLEQITGKGFGDRQNPLLVSVRSGAAVSMPGMMDTVLNLGLNDETVQGLIKKTNNLRFAYDVYRRFVQMFGDVVLGVEHSRFEKLLQTKKEARGVKYDTELTVEDLKDLVNEFKKIVKEETGKDFPDEPWTQLKMATNAVFSSWNNKRAITYREIHKIPHNMGTAVNVQTMVFGNMGNNSGTGVAFTRNPSTGEKIYYGEFLLNAQGEDVVAGIRTPQPLSELGKYMPEIYKHLCQIFENLEKHYRDMQDVEFTIEEGKLYILQTRSGKRTAQASVNIAVDMVREGLIDKETAILKVSPEQLDQLLHPMIDPHESVQEIAKGLPASPGAAVGKVVFNSQEAIELAEKGEKVILVRAETSPEDIGGMAKAQGILTARGGMTCISGDTMLLTPDGFLTASEIYKKLEEGEQILILSYDTNEKSAIFRKVIAYGRRKEKLAEILISPTGRTRYNTLKITLDHRFYTIENRKLVKKSLSQILEKDGFVLAIDRIPRFGIQNMSTFKSKSSFAYLLGAISTDGYINVKKTKGSVTFTQSNIPSKFEFIDSVNSAFKDSFGYEIGHRRERLDALSPRGKSDSSVIDLITTRRMPAETIRRVQEEIISWVLKIDEIALLNFLASVIDGDGTFVEGRIQIYVSKRYLLEAIIIACLRLGILPQVTVNRNIYNVQIVEGIDNILHYTKRVKGKAKDRYYGTKFYSIISLFSDLGDNISYKGRMRLMLKRNLLMGIDKFRNIYPECSSSLKSELDELKGLPFRMLRLKKAADLLANWVYNFEVEENSEMNKNYIVFTKFYTPILVSNSHAAVVGRGMGKCCVVGCNDISINEEEGYFEVKELKVKKGDTITLNGTTGDVILGSVKLVKPQVTGNFKILMEWVDNYKKLGVRANADNPHDSKVARDFGAEGIGLCRTEHMFFGQDRIKSVRRMILSDNEEERRKALDEILPLQRQDFIEIFKVMEGLPVTIRLLDPPLHEFLPANDEDIERLSKELGIEKTKLRTKVEQLKEFNPMLGHRGCRLGITYPEISRMQAQAIFEAQAELLKLGKKVIVEVMIPLVGDVNEIKFLKREIEAVAKEIEHKENIGLDYTIGTMIEVPRACITADEIAEVAEFFSFGTNDLTQMAYGFSRDDIAKFLPAYLEKGILNDDPFMVLDREGVGELIRIGIEKGRKRKPNLKVGICGEHGGEPSSVIFCHKVGMNYVSCSPYRVPVAKLALAQAVLKEKQIINGV